MAKKTSKSCLALSKADIVEINRQDKLVHTPKISLREYPVTENRNPYQRDYARIVYSSAFRRLQGKMQILGIEGSAFFRNRLTHSLEVAQIAKGIRWELDKAIKQNESAATDLFLLDAAALAHDIGHPAFGHKGERVLNGLAHNYGLHFEGNAQNFRVLRHLEKKSPEYDGLDLTYRTLLAINKYLVPEGFGVSKFMYKDDYDVLAQFRNYNNLAKTRTIDVQIIELADDIAYAVHDLEDALAQGYLTLDELVYELELYDSYLKGFSPQDCSESAYQMKQIIEKQLKRISKTNYNGNIQAYSQNLRKMLTTELTSLFIKDIHLGFVSTGEAMEHGTLAGARELKLNKYASLCKLLSKKIFRCVLRKPIISIYENRGEIVIKRLFDLYTNTNFNKGGQLLSPEYRAQLKPSDTQFDISRKYAKCAIDYIAGMMDNFAMQQYANYFNCQFADIPLI